MSRKAIPLDIENEVLLLCRRRCCICSSLNRNLEIVQGQIAHLNHDAANSVLDNLVYLCLPHHDQYDSRTSQSKGLKESEVRHFRAELHRIVATFLALPIMMGAVEVQTQVEGRYVRDGSGQKENAEVQVKLIATDNIVLTGFSQFWSTGRSVPSHGFLNFETELREGRKAFHENQDYGHYRLLMTFERGLLFLEESNSGGMFGINVTFGGMYRRIGDVRPVPPKEERRKTPRGDT